ncbi:alpha/beta fold hydrolase [Isoptericola sp. QY 916]|uniref:alpha/beta fold hydrolase n=1 Tax=Isoptericola sp. QY 916 TaxID=2782570 RepID=UPI003D2FAB40|nr:alpha/beta hydrolase [Isoptericola sp. QY 916]
MAARSDAPPRPRAPVPVVLVHGSRTSATMWRRQLEALGRAGVPAVATDLPGHGARRGEPFTLDGAVDAVHDAVEGLGGRALVAGLSLGGYVAIEHRARHPEQSAGLVAASCCTESSSSLRPAWLSLARWIEGWPDHGARLNDAVVRLALDAEGAGDLGAGGYALTAMAEVLRELGPTDTLGALAAARSPVWFVNGRYDHFRAQERAFVAAARAGGAAARLVVVPHARHLVSLDAPVAFTRALLEAETVVTSEEAAVGVSPVHR